MKKVIERLEAVKGGIKDAREFFSRETVNDILIGIDGLIDQAIAELQAPPRWYTPEQWEQRTGEKWKDDWAVYLLNPDKVWEPMECWRAKQIDQDMADLDRDFAHVHESLPIVCATEAGPPPAGWRPEE
jgi:hypothetical protein